ncbi:MAG: hypothetical protein M2R45_03863 [Verrucomicrobia subdivision 3 bacterium]|nr:hypothetical protein [Limisphaerales bacterium]MCS1412567.1 hypothetical protein [Limisphaerales bacterium]
MVAYINSPRAPWKLIAGNNKRFVRIQTINTICKQLESALACPATPHRYLYGERPFWPHFGPVKKIRKIAISS